MTGRIDGWRGLRNGVAGAVLAAGLALGSTVTAYAEPTPTPTPPPAPAPTTPVKPSVLPSSTATVAPTVEVSGGAQAATPSTATAGATDGKAADGTAAAGTAADGTAAVATGDVLDTLAKDYAVGSGGGQLSNLLRTSLKLRSMGFKPSKQYLDEVTAAMAYRPNQLPLISALKDTIAYQQKIQAQQQILINAQGRNANSAVMGAGQMPADSNPANVAPQAPQGAALPGPAPAGAVPLIPATP